MLFLFIMVHIEYWASLVAQLVKNLPAMRETWVRSLGWDIWLSPFVVHLKLL